MTTIKETANKILKKHEDKNEYRFHESERKFIIKAMMEVIKSQTTQDIDLQTCEICERQADLDLMHSYGDDYICEICNNKIPR